MAGVCSGPGPCDVTPLGEGKNWVTKVGGLPLYIRAIAHALRRSGHSQSESIQLAVGTVQRWARGGGNVTGPTRARAAAALAEWERKRAEAHLSGSDAVSIDLAYQWKHGWIPLTPASLAVKLHKAHGGASGLKSNDVRKALGTHKDFREGFERGRAEVKGRSFSPGDLRDSARKHEAAAATHLQHAGDSFYPQATKDATREAGHAAGLRHEASLSQRRFHHQAKGDEMEAQRHSDAMGALSKLPNAVRTSDGRLISSLPKPKAVPENPALKVNRPSNARQLSPQYVKTGVPTHVDVDALIHNYTLAHGKAPSAAAAAKLRAKARTSRGHLTAVKLAGGNRMAIDLAGSQMLPDMAAVRKAAANLSKLPPPLRKAMAARLAARAKQLGGSVSMSNTGGRIVDLAVDQAQRDAAKSAGLTFPGTDSFPLAGSDGKFDAGLAKKAVGMVQLSNAASAPAIRKWLMSKLKANGAAGIIPDAWQPDGTVKS